MIGLTSSSHGSTEEDTPEKIEKEPHESKTEEGETTDKVNEDGSSETLQAEEKTDIKISIDERKM